MRRNLSDHCAVPVRRRHRGFRQAALHLFYIDGDEASLKPMMSEPSQEYMWSSQRTGVGHFAKYAEARLSQADPAKLAQELGATEIGAEEAGPVVIPRGGDEMILSGRFRVQFWIGTLIIGNVLPLILAWFGGPMFLAHAGVFVLISIYITEHLWVRAPQLIPLS